MRSKRENNSENTWGYFLPSSITAAENGCRKIVPLMLRLWSSVHPEFVSENDEVEQVIGQIASTTNGRGIFVYDRGGDGDNLFKFYIDRWCRGTSRDGASRTR